VLAGDSLSLPHSRSRCTATDDAAETTDFRALYDQFFPLVWKWAARFGIPRDALDDVVQEVFLAIHAQLGQFEGRSSLKTWVFGVTLGVTRNYRRKRTTGPAGDGCEMDSLPDSVAHPEAAAAHTEALSLLQRILNELDVEKREVFILAELEQLSLAEIATLLQISSNTVTSRLRLAREAVQMRWERAKARDQWRSR